MAETAPRPGAEHDDWTAHRLDQLALWASATPAQRLAWLEEMLALAHRAGALPARTEPPADRP